MLKKFKCKSHLGHRLKGKPLSEIPTLHKPYYKDDDEYDRLIKASREELAKYQELLYAHDRYSLLLILQGMDTSGKDSLVKHVFSGVNPQGCSVATFKKPTATELDHDFLWRTVRELPARGQIGIFNRSYYEDVLIVRVHEQILANTKLPASCLGEKNFWNDRLKDIRHHEEYLRRQGTIIIKVFLHLSYDEQRKRLLDRLSDPTKHWKFDPTDINERKYWKEYEKAYNKCIIATSTDEAPWYVIPADDKKNARLMVSHLLVEKLSEFKLKHPKVTQTQHAELKKIEKALRAGK